MNETEYRLIPGGVTSDGWVVATSETEARPQIKAVRCFRSKEDAQHFMNKLQIMAARPHASLGAALTGAFRSKVAV